MNKKEMKKRIKTLEEDVGRITFIVDELAKKQFGPYFAYHAIKVDNPGEESPLMRLFRSLGED